MWYIYIYTLYMCILNDPKTAVILPQLQCRIHAIHAVLPENRCERCKGKNDVPNMGVSKNRGTPNWMVKIMENPIKNGWFGGKTHNFRKHPICLQKLPHFLLSILNRLFKIGYIRSTVFNEGENHGSMVRHQPEKAGNQMQHRVLGMNTCDT